MIMEFVTCVVMERSRMNLHHSSGECEKGVDEFLQFAHQNEKPINGTYFYPYICCLDQIRQDLGRISDHLVFSIKNVK